jgi:hypothetical protein
MADAGHNGDPPPAQPAPESMQAVPEEETILIDAGRKLTNTDIRR